MQPSIPRSIPSAMSGGAHVRPLSRVFPTLRSTPFVRRLHHTAYHVDPNPFMRNDPGHAFNGRGAGTSGAGAASRACPPASSPSMPSSFAGRRSDSDAHSTVPGEKHPVSASATRQIRQRIAGEYSTGARDADTFGGSPQAAGRSSLRDCEWPLQLAHAPRRPLRLITAINP